MIIFEPFIMLAVKTCEYLVRLYVALILRPNLVFTDPSVQKLKFNEPCIIISNHTNTFDPLMLLTQVKGRRNILVAKDWYEMPKFHWLLKRFKAIPIDRFNPLDASWLAVTKKEIAKGSSIIIFPEGKCREDGLLNEFKSGFAMLARSTGLPVVSIGNDSIYNFKHRTNLIVGNAEKIERVKGVSSGEYLAQKSEYFRQKVWTLKQQALGITENVPVLPIAAETPAEVTAESVAEEAK